MATNARNYLRTLMESPGSYSGSPGFQFGLDQGQQAIGRRANAGGMRGSGNVLAALAQHAVGTAQQGYGDEVQRRIQAAGLEQQGELAGNSLALEGELGRGRLALDDKLGAGRLALEDRLGTGALDVNRGRLGLEGELGRGRLEQDRLGSERDFGLGLFRANTERDLGQGELPGIRSRVYQGTPMHQPAFPPRPARSFRCSS